MLMNLTRNPLALVLSVGLLWLSTLSADAWQLVTNGLPVSPSIGRISTDGSLAAMVVSSASSGSTGVYVSTNGGVSWFRASGNLPGSGQIPTTVIVVSNTIYAARSANQSTGGNVVVRSTDKGASWQASVGFPNSSSIDLLAFDGSQFFAARTGSSAANGVVWRSSDGINWSSVSSHSGSFNNGYVRSLGGSNNRAIAATTTGIYVLSGSGTNWLRASGDSLVSSMSRMAWHVDRTLMLNVQVGRPAIAILDGVTNVVNISNGLPDGTVTYRDVAASIDTAFISAQVLSPSITWDAKIFQTSDRGTNWIELQSPPVLGNADPATLCVISNSLFLGMNSPGGLYRVTLIDDVPFFAPTISGIGGTIGVHPGTNLIFNATVTGEGTISMQWRKDGVDIPGETGATLTLPNVETNASGIYTLAASNPGGTTVSSAINLIVLPRAPGSRNLDFNPGYFADDSFGFAVQATPFAVAALTNGQILVGGNFSLVNATPNNDGFSYSDGLRRPGLARFNPDGSVDSSFGTTSGISSGGTVNAICVQPDGKILVAGQFSSWAGVPQTNITRLNADGSLDDAFATNAFNNGANIWAVSMQSDGKILIGGSFSSINGQLRNGAARLLSNGALDTSWPVGTGIGGSVNELLVLPDDQTLFGGSFFSVNGDTSRRYLALLDTTGAANSTFNHGLNSSVSGIKLQVGGLIWVAGGFSTYSNAPVTSIVRLNANGDLIGSTSTNLSNPSNLVPQEDGKLIATSYRSATFDYGVLRFNSDATVDTTFNGGRFDIAPQDMTISRDGDLYAVGTFSSYNGLPASKFVKIYATSNNVPADAPEFVAEPADVSALFGQNVTLTAAVVGKEPMSFWWLKDGSILDGANATSLTLTNLVEEHLGGYQLIASNSLGSITSRVATVSAASPPSFVQQPPAITGSTNGGTVSVLLDVAGSAPLSFQWYRNNSSQSGFTNNPLVLSNLNVSLTGNWHVVVSNAFGRATSSIVSVQIGTIPAITGQPSNQQLNGEGNVTLQVIANVSSTTPLTYLWYQNNNLVSAQTTNVFLNQLVISNAVPSHSGSYYVVITNFAGSVTSIIRTVTVRNPFFSQSPTSITALEGTSTNFSATAGGTTPIDYYWFRRSFGSPSVTNLAGTGSSLSFNPVTRPDGRFNYFVVASNVWGSVTSSLTSITVDFPTAITNMSPTNIVAELNENVFFYVLYEASPFPTARWYKDGVLQPQLFNASVSLNSVQATNAGTYQLVLSNYVNSVTSAPIVLTVKPPRPPEITNQPPALKVAGPAGGLNIPIGVDGTPVMYARWFRDEGIPVTGWQTSMGLSLSSPTTNDSGNYYVIVTNAYGSATSAVSAVTIIQPQQPVFGNKQFVKIADTLTKAPGLNPHNFSSFRDAFIRGGQVWFNANAGPSFGFPAGVFHWNGSVVTNLVTTNTLVPGTSSHFTEFFGSTYLSAGKVIFGAYGSGDEHGIYAWTNNSVITIHDKSTLIPGRTETFERFGWPTVAGDQFAFLGFSIPDTNIGWQYRGVFVSSNGVITKLADTNSALPGLGGHFQRSSSQVGFDGNKVVWWALNEFDRGGIFTVTRQLVLNNVADELTINPSSGVNFDGFISPPNVYTGRVYFVGHDIDFNTSMFYRDGDGPIQTVGKPGDPIPGRGMPFDSVGYPAQIGSSAGLFFGGQDGTGYTGIFYWNGSTIVKVIDSLDSLDGMSISYVFFSDAEGDNIVFHVGFTNGRQALYAMLPGEGATFSQWATSYNFPPGQSDPEDDADGDGIKNAFEYYFGSDPTSASSGAMPSGTTVTSGGQTYPAITFIRSKSASDVTLLPQASSNVNFTDSLGTIVESVVDLGDGTERVTIRSTVSSSVQGAQFLRIQVAL